jgi:glycogen synthase
MQNEKWKKDWKLIASFYTENEIQILKERIKEIKINNLVYCSFENRFARSGGLAAVAANILPYIKEINKISSVYLMTPLYSNLVDKSKLKQATAFFTVPFEGRTIKAKIYEYIVDYNKPAVGSLVEYYLEADGFFNAVRDPYIYDEADLKNNESIIGNNSLFFCKAVPFALKALGIVENIVFHLQEWQTALISLTSKEAILNGTLKSCATLQTMHNPYDFYFSKDLLGKIIDNERIKKTSLSNGFTAYQLGLQLVDGPVTTVSDSFAKEFTSDILQTDYFAPHLQDIFTYNGVFGVNNGMFIDFSKEFPKRSKHSISDISKIKMKNRKALLNILDEYKPSERFGELTYKGASITNLPDDMPIFVMSGRLDPNQKGYDIFLQTIEKFAQDEIKVIMTPMPIRKADLDFFYEVACKCRGDITVFPTRMQKGFTELQLGSTFGVMPSIYEPFGAAVEYMANGTVNIARATGGLSDQIDHNKNGLSFKEKIEYYTLKNIQEYLSSCDCVQMRRKNIWAMSMSDALYKVMRDAIELYQKSPKNYYQLILNGFKKAEKFTWDKAAAKYYKMYEKVKTA